MKFALSISGVTIGAMLSASLLVPTVSFASDADGMRCPSGFNTGFSNGVLKCSRQVTTNVEVRKSVCPIFTDRYTQRTNAADVCFNNQGQAVLTVPEFVLDPQNWTRDIDGSTGALDRFTKGGQVTTDFTWPVAVNGVYGF